MASSQGDPAQGLEALNLSKFTADHLLRLIQAANLAIHGEVIFIVPDERAMRAAARRGLAYFREEPPMGWVLTDLCYAWAAQHARKGRLQLIQGGLSQAASG